MLGCPGSNSGWALQGDVGCCCLLCYTVSSVHHEIELKFRLLWDRLSVSSIRAMLKAEAHPLAS